MHTTTIRNAQFIHSGPFNGSVEGDVLVSMRGQPEAFPIPYADMSAFVDKMRESDEVETEVRFWIQEQAPAGNWNDSVGLGLDTTQAEALAEIKSWQKTFPDRTTRLVLKTTINTVLG